MNFWTQILYFIDFRNRIEISRTSEGARGMIFSCRFYSSRIDRLISTKMPFPFETHSLMKSVLFTSIRTDGVIPMEFNAERTTFLVADPSSRRIRG